MIPIKSILILSLFTFLFLNMIYIYYNKSCDDLSPQQRCVCNNLMQKRAGVLQEDFRDYCLEYRQINE